MQNTKELRDLSAEELSFRRDEAQRELFTLKNNMRKNRKDQKLHVLPQKRKEVARLNTLIHERNIAK